MQVRVDVEDQIDSSEELIVRVEGVVEGSLDRFQGRIARVDVHLAQLRQGGYRRDMSCRMEAYADALSPIEVSHEAVTLTEAIHAASAKLQRAIAGMLGRAKSKDASAETEDAGARAEDGFGHLRSS
jgi:hypothetical protein